jgi:beta-glucuronidase
MLRFLGLILVGLGMTAPTLRAQMLNVGTAPLLVDSDHRAATSLDGDWHYIVDPYRNGWGGDPDKPTLNGFAADKHFTLGGPLLEYDFAKSPTLKVPGDWNTQNPKLYYYEGLLWYEREVDYHARPGHKVFLQVGAANYMASLFVNDKHICDHEGGFTQFDCDVTSALKDGKNSIVIAVDNTRKAERVPTLKTDWWNYGGITREVSLIEVPEKYVDDYGLTLQKDGKPGEAIAGIAYDTISGYVHVEGATAGTTVSLRIPELKVEQTAPTDANGKAAFSFRPTGLKRWSPKDPRLYKVEIKSGEDSLTDDIGFRTVEARGDQILLNGEPIFLRGVCIHAEAPYRTGRAFSEKDVETLLGWVHDLDANYVRLAHYPHSERMTRLADKMGILVWSENPVYWGIDWSNEGTFAIARQQLDEEIRRDHNKAAVILWSMANETQISDPRTEFIHKLAEEARAQDPTRLITAALLPHNVTKPDGEKAIVLDDPLGQYLDVIGLNEYIGWYGGAPEDAPKTNWEDPLDKPVIVSEFGAGAKAGLHGDGKFTEDYQARVFREQLEMFRRMPFLAGMTPWVLMDFRSPTRLLPGIQDDFNRKGLISDQGQKKAAFQVLKDFYESNPQPPAKP